MKRQRAIYQMKEQDKTPEKQLNEVEIGNLPEKEFRIIIVKVIQDLRKRIEAKIEKMQETFNKDVEEVKNKQTEMNNTIIEMKNTLEGIKSRITEAEEQISDLEDRMVEFTAAEQNKEKGMTRNEDSLRELWDNIKRNNIHIIGVPEGEEREKGPEKISEEIIVKNFPNMGKEIATQGQEAQRVPYRINPRRNTPRHIVIKLAKIKRQRKIIESSKGKMTNNIQGNSHIRLTADFSAETLQARREWHDIFKVMKGKNLQPRLLYLARISFRFNGEIKSFTDKQNLRELSTTKPALQQMLKELL
uniref:L1 transposable element RRM domain-containing protein n=1 Tax=Phocoena sinus TaxID=42100 RepID=A0A8C9BEN8_PHOSS